MSKKNSSFDWFTYIIFRILARTQKYNTRKLHFKILPAISLITIQTSILMSHIFQL